MRKEKCRYDDLSACNDVTSTEVVFVRGPVKCIVLLKLVQFSNFQFY